MFSAASSVFEWMMYVKNRKDKYWQDNTVYFYIDQPIVIIKIFWQIHMAKVRYIKTQKEVIIDVGVIRGEPSKELSISMNWLRRNTE